MLTVMMSEGIEAANAQFVAKDGRADNGSFLFVLFRGSWIVMGKRIFLLNLACLCMS